MILSMGEAILFLGKGDLIYAGGSVAAPPRYLPLVDPRPARRAPPPPLDGPSGLYDCFTKCVERVREESGLT